jgi:hypothetical protein
MDTATATPAEIDIEICRLENIMSASGQRLVSLRRDFGEAKTQAAGYGATRRVRSIEEITADIEATEKIRFATHHQLSPLYDEFIRRGGWTRWYLVPNGHLHYDVSGDRCSRIPTTEHYWMTDHSGRSADEMIELAGDRVCTTCFPDAPVAPRPATARFMTPNEAERAAYREAADRKRAAAKAAQMTTSEGDPLYTATGYRGDLIKTEVAARRRALQDATDIAFYGTSHPSFDEWRETVDRMIAAIVHRDVTHFGGTGLTEEALRAEINTKIAKKAKREQWTVHAQI